MTQVTGFGKQNVVVNPADKMSLGALLSPLDAETSKQQLKAKVKMVYDAVPSYLHARIQKMTEGNNYVLFTTGGDTTFEELDSTIDELHPRYIDVLNRFIPTIRTPIQFTSGTIKIGLESEDARNLFGNLLQFSNRFKASDPGRALGTIMFNKNFGLSEYLRYTEDEKKDALRFEDVPEDRLDIVTGRLTNLITYRQVLNGITHSMQTRADEIVKLRTDAGFQDSRKRQFWTDDRIATLEPGGFWSPERAQQVNPEGFMRASFEILNNWGSLDEKERMIYESVLRDVAEVAISTPTYLQAAIIQVTSELSCSERGEKIYNEQSKAVATVDPDSPGFTSQLERIKVVNMAGYEDQLATERWGHGIWINQMNQRALNMKQQLVPMLANALGADYTGLYAKLMDPEQVGAGLIASDNMKSWKESSARFADNLVEIDHKNHELAKIVWVTQRSEKPIDTIEHVWPLLLLVNKDYSPDSNPYTGRDFPSITLPLLKANADRPFICEYARGFTVDTPPKDIAVFDSYLTQDYIDNHLGRMQVDTAKAVCLAFRSEDARQYLTPATPQGREFLQATVDKPELFNPIQGTTGDDLRAAFIGCVVDTNRRAHLSGLCHRSYYPQYGILYAVMDDEQRARVSSPDFIGLVDNIASGNPHNANFYLSALSVPDDRSCLLSDPVFSILNADPDNAKCIYRLQELGKMPALRQHIIEPDNVDFFSSQLAHFSEKAESGQWNVATASLKYLEGGV